MKPIEVLKRDYVNTPLGFNCALIKGMNKDCVVAYKQLELITYLLIKTSKDYKSYLIVEFEKSTHPSDCVGREIPNNRFLNLKGIKIIDRKEFKKFKGECFIKSI